MEYWHCSYPMIISSLSSDVTLRCCAVDVGAPIHDTISRSSAGDRPFQCYCRALSAACGLRAGRFAVTERRGLHVSPPPQTSALGALLGHIVGGADAESFQPMNINFGLFPPLDTKLKKGRRGRRDRRAAFSQRALEATDEWIRTQATLQ